MQELLVPLPLGFFLAAGLGLNVVQGQGDPDLELGLDGFHGSFGRLMSAHHKDVALGSAGGNENLGLGRAEELYVLRCLLLHPFHHRVFHVDTHLHLTLGALILLHQLHITLGDSCNLEAHVGLIDGADVGKKVSQPLDHIFAVGGKFLDGSLILPSALLNEPFGAGEVQHSYDGFHAVFAAALQYFAVMLDLTLVKHTGLRLDPRPFDGEAVGVQPRACQKFDVLLIAVIVVAGVAAGLIEAGKLHVFHGPVIAVDVIALHLMGCGGSADQNAFGKTHVLISFFT